ncbi:hypothetical protein, partial [Pseudomonas aeruginosa]|uniref:hypothetical protein n=1 Tax=Pseudomonas aeruginosa TaxID=287 RepID=UPI003D335A91
MGAVASQVAGAVQARTVGGERVGQEAFGGQAGAARMRGLSASTWNLYGPTETTIWSARFRLGEEARPFLGGPLENTALYILD